MPKLPLFKDQPLNQGIITLLRELRENPESGDGVSMIGDLATLQQNPSAPMSERLTYFAIDVGLLPNAMLTNFLVTSLDRPHLIGVQAAMRLEINQRLLAHWRVA